MLADLKKSFTSGFDVKLNNVTLTLDSSQ